MNLFICSATGSADVIESPDTQHQSCEVAV